MKTNDYNANDMLVLVDVNDNEIGTDTKIGAHFRGALHRAFSLFVVSDNKMLVQKRAEGKYHSAGLWTNACCSHPRAGEALDAAVVRRCKEELGLTIDSAFPLFSFVYRADYGQVIEYEYDHVYLSLVDEVELQPNPAEVSDVEWISFADLKNQLIDEPERFSCWFIIAAPHVLEAVDHTAGLGKGISNSVASKLERD